jgi:hypothetical protein
MIQDFSSLSQVIRMNRTLRPASYHHPLSDVSFRLWRNHWIPVPGGSAHALPLPL